MNPIYIYKHHQFNDIFLRSEELTPEELYCAYCDDSDTLITVCHTEEEFDKAMEDLMKTHGLLPCEDYKELVEKYQKKE